ncbi:hypothetical protein [Alkalibacillus almallahensis]|uniref:hypothetical protein n=1 Tax=Alkalibacillus almallahensis TaxID=1379154 RepID=UPI00141D82C8|nr:hypothetical protein [Alkalibacillus almallahensis]NIK13305.1 hypothetical protein [Alkalibacillus almallahensis]
MKEVMIGVLGPEDSVERSLEVIDKLEGIRAYPYSYENTEDVKPIIEQHRYKVDQWLFSGPYPYSYAIDAGVITSEEGTYATLHGSSLLSVLLNIFIDFGYMVDQISLDTIGEELLDSEQLQSVQFHRVSQGRFYEPHEQVVEFHQQKYDQGDTAVAVTCIHAVYRKLKARGVPVYRVVPSEISIQLALDYLKQRAYTHSYQKKQFVILGVDVVYPSAVAEGFVPYQTQHQELDLHRAILKMSEQVNGSMVKIGGGKYFIYTTRGDVDIFLQEHSIRERIDQMAAQSGLDIRVGIGYGHTVLEADEHLQIAFGYAGEPEYDRIVLVNEDKEVLSVSQQDFPMLTQQRIADEDWLKRLNDLSINPTQLSRIYALIHHYEKNELTAQELAHWLQRSERNARRILVDLEEVGLAKVVGEESGQRGRPKKVYQILNPS